MVGTTIDWDRVKEINEVFRDYSGEGCLRDLLLDGTDRLGSYEDYVDSYPDGTLRGEPKQTREEIVRKWELSPREVFDLLQQIVRDAIAWDEDGDASGQYIREELTKACLNLSLCPLHRVDYAICFDDEDPECELIRRLHPSHDT